MTAPFCSNCKWYSLDNPTRDIPKHACLHAVDLIHGKEWAVPIFEARKHREPYSSNFVSRDASVNTYGLLFMPCGPEGKFFEPKTGAAELIPIEDLGIRICAKFGRLDQDFILHDPLIRRHSACDVETCPATQDYAQLAAEGRMRGTVRHELPEA